MIKIIPTLITAAFLTVTGCSAEEPSKTILPEPFLKADKEWLYLVVEAAGGLKNRCYKHWQTPKDPRFSPYKQQCIIFELDLRDALRHNKFPTVKTVHIRSPAFEKWFSGERKKVWACRKKIGGRNREYYNCDPLEKILQNNTLSLKEVGINIKKRHNINNFDPNYNPYKTK